jgi:bifunctional non-homologous end joining protein LigD
MRVSCESLRVGPHTHAWLSRIDTPHHPDRLIFDLDPPDDNFAPVRASARSLRSVLSELGLTSYVMTTGRAARASPPE